MLGYSFVVRGGGLLFGMLIRLHIWEHVIGGLIYGGCINRILKYLRI